VTPDDAFLRHIIESPDDDTPQLVHADWLDDHGQPERAEFIRVQCELASAGTDHARRVELRAKERSLCGVTRRSGRGRCRGPRRTGSSGEGSSRP
jgi:uncharacterized protein (TIGR02996 family)